jgi:hypothetical protein
MIVYGMIKGIDHRHSGFYLSLFFMYKQQKAINNI